MTNNQKPEAWIPKARVLAEEYKQLHQLKYGTIPGINEIAQRVEGELADRNILTSKGKHPGWQSIKKFALFGITGRLMNGQKVREKRKIKP